MNYHPFPALLQSDYNETHVFGSAYIYDSEQNTSGINFTNDFVPLLPLGSAATVSWIHGKDEIAAFDGKVYLSSSGCLRIVGINETLLNDARSTFAMNTSLPAFYSPSKTQPAATCQIIYLDTSYVTLKTLLPKEEESPYIFLNCEVDFLTLDNLELEVIKQINLTYTETLLFCKVLETGNFNLIALSAYSARLERI